VVRLEWARKSLPIFLLRWDDRHDKEEALLNVSICKSIESNRMF